ncbi:ABC transporter, periplasmic substrate-binding protein, MCE domain-containing [Geotalea daltonii FRC-32]|uniref:ABC transporter, periplasmic substrate-binding protein, MCE domain-containing n=1 Tax=Geotalea daltonii (strain DSM 22248 / JCM 15807 / FRC-32) TaxID=316067 RepID=B9M5E6_GEODF|nr:MlaD family protein [Geotalea daltonii]ACM19901.1 ABC transporter, periplasmic substrate-binding protein, MCE domain-containing [Geotalea daltonii FRC-32]
MAISVEKKVGIFFILGLILFGFMLEVGEKWNPFEKKVMYKTFLTSITGLKIGDPVRLAGVDVGKIDKITILEEKVQIDFEVKPGTRIKTDSVATLRLTNLLGGQFLGISFGSPGAPILPPGGTVKGRDVANIDIIVDNVSEVVQDAKLLITQLNENQNEVMGKISAILDDNRTNLQSSIANINSITTKLDRGDGSLAMLLNDKLLYENFRDASASVKNIALKIDKGEGTIGKLVNDDLLYSDARSAMARINDSMKDVKDIAAKINRGEGTMGKLVNDEALYNEVRDASKNIKEITRKINDGEGTLGKLVNDDKLYRDTTATLKKAEKAMDGLGDTGPIQVLGSVIGTLF